MKKYLKYIIIFLLFPYILMAAQISATPDNLNFLFNPSKNQLEPTGIKISISNIDLDTNFSWNIQINSSWIKVDNWNGSGNNSYIVEVSIDKDQLLNFPQGNYQGVITINSDIGVKLIFVNLSSKVTPVSLNYGILNLKNIQNYMKIPLPYTASWEVASNINHSITFSDLYIFNQNENLDNSSENFNKVDIKDLTYNNNFTININNYSKLDLYNFYYTASTATPINSYIVIPPSNNNIYVKVTTQYMFAKEEEFYLTKFGIEKNETPYLDDNDLPNFEDYIIKVGSFILKMPGIIDVNIYNEQQNLAHISYNIQSLSGKWSIIDHFMNYDLRYNMNIIDCNKLITGWLEYNNASFPFSLEKSQISDDGFYIFQLAPPNEAFYIKIPYYFVSKNHFIGFLMKNNTLVSRIEGFKTQEKFYIDGKWRINKILKSGNYFTDNYFQNLNIQIKDNSLILANNVFNIQLNKVSSNYYMLSNLSTNNINITLNELYFYILDENTLFITGEYLENNTKLNKFLYLYKR